MSNPNHRISNNDRVAIEQRTRMIKELNTISDNTANSGSGSSSNVSIIKGLTDIDDENTAKFISIDTSGAIRINNINESNMTNGDQITQLMGRTNISNASTKVHLRATNGGALDIKNVNELLDNGKAQVFLTSSGGTSVKADSSCVIQADPEFRNGWNCVNSTASTKFNLYIFNGAEETLTLGDLTSIYFKGYINRYTGVQSMPFLQVYTKPTGSGDAGSFYHSRINWVYNADDSIGIGEECIFYGEAEPSSQFTNRKIELTSKTVQGDGADTEEILYVVCASDSSASQNEMNATINLIGFNNSNIKRNYHLVGRSLLSDTYEILQDTDNISTKINNIETDISTLAGCENNSNLNVKVLENSDLSSRTIINDNTTSTFLKCDSTGILNIGLNAYKDILDDTSDIKVHANGNGQIEVNDTILSGKWTTDITNNIKGDIDSINVNTANTDSKISVGSNDITDGTNIQRVLCYVKDQSNNLHPIDSDSNGHLKITIQDIEPNITSSIKVENEVKRSNTQITNDSSGTALSGSLGGYVYSETVDLDNFKEINILINSTSSAALELWASHSSTANFVFYDDMYSGGLSGGISYKNNSICPRYIRIYNNSTTAYTFNDMRVHMAR